MKNPSVICLTALLLLIALSAPPAVSAQARDAQSPPPSAAEIVKDLQSPNRVRRERALKAAMAIKPLPIALLQDVLRACRDLSTRNDCDPNAPARPEPPVCNTEYLVQELLLALNDNGAAAADTLTRLAHDSPAVWPAVITAMANAHYGIPFVIAEDVSDKIGAPIAPLLVRSLSDRNLRIRGGSALALSFILKRYGTTSALNKYRLTLSGVVLDIAKVLNSIDPDLRAQTIGGLAAIGPPAQGAIPYVLPMFKDSDWRVRSSTAYFFGAMGPAGTMAIPDLLKLLKDDTEWPVRWAAMNALGGFGPAAKDAVPELAIALKSTDNKIIEESSLALANIDPSHEEILPGIMLALDDPTEKQNAFKALEKIGSRAKPAVPALEHLIATDLDSGPWNFKAWERHAAVTALAQIEGADAIPELQLVMRTDTKDEVRIAAVTALGELGSSNPLAISVLVGAFNESPPIREAASDALVRIGSPAVSALIAALKNGNLYQRAWSVQTLSQIKPLPGDAAHALTLALSDKSEIVRTEAADALKGNKVNALNAIGHQRMVESENAGDQDEDLDSLAAGERVADPRIYSKAEIIASIPPDENHAYPSELKFSVPVVPSGRPSEAAEFLVTLHSAKDGTDRLAVWKRTGDNKYQRLAIQQSQQDSNFEEPTVFSSKVLVRGRGREHYETALFVDLPVRRYWGDGEGVFDNVYVLDHDELRPVAIADAEKDSKQLRDDESVWNGAFGNDFKDNDLEFGFPVWEGGAMSCHVCVTPFEVDGTYKVVKEMHYDPQKKDWVANWKMVVDTAKRVRRSNN